MATTRKATLKISRPARKRSTYAERTRQNSAAALKFVAAYNGHDDSWSHDTIRTALLRQAAIEIDELLEELPRQAAGYAIGKGWIYRAAGSGYVRVTKRAAADLNLPKKTSLGVPIRFIDVTRDMPDSLPLVDPVKVEKPITTEERFAQLVAMLAEPRGVMDQARAYVAVLKETGWVPRELARRMVPDDAAAQEARWVDILSHLNLIILEPEYQEAADRGQLTLMQAGELMRAEPVYRPRLFAGMLTGWSISAVRKMARTGQMNRKPAVFIAELNATYAK